MFVEPAESLTSGKPGLLTGGSGQTYSGEQCAEDDPLYLEGLRLMVELEVETL